MRNILRPAPFVLVSTNQGTLIVNQNDCKMVDQTSAVGVGVQLMTTSCMDPQEVDLGELLIPEPDYLVPSSYGSLSLIKGEETEFIGQEIDYANASAAVDLVSIDSLGLERLDFLKIDVEGMEMDVLEGAATSLRDLAPADPRGSAQVRRCADVPLA